MKLRIILLTMILALVALGGLRAQVSHAKPVPGQAQQVQPAPHAQQSFPLVRPGEAHSTVRTSQAEDKREELCRKLERRQLELRRREQREVIRERREN
jgi:hypothetical protein